MPFKIIGNDVFCTSQMRYPPMSVRFSLDLEITGCSPRLNSGSGICEVYVDGLHAFREVEKTLTSLDHEFLYVGNQLVTTIALKSCASAILNQS